MKFNIEMSREDDGRWIADVVDLPGVMCYGASRDDAIAHAEALALRVIADRLEHGEEVHDREEIGRAMMSSLGRKPDCNPAIYSANVVVLWLN